VGMEQQTIDRIRAGLNLPDCVSDQDIVSTYTDTRIEAYANLYLATEDFKAVCAEMLETSFVPKLADWLERQLQKITPNSR